MFDNLPKPIQPGPTEEHAAQSKGERTKRKIYDISMRLFREQGFDETTMREISKQAGISLGSTYYYFASKEAIIAAYYEENQTLHHAYVQQNLYRAKTLEDRLRLLFRSKVELVQADRKLLGTIFRYTGDPKHPLSFLGESTRYLQEQSIETIQLALAGERLTKEVQALLPMALWALQMGTLLYLLYDTSEQQTRTFKLIDQSIALTTQLIQLTRQPLAQPLLAPLFRQVIHILDQAEINIKSPASKE